GLWGGGGGGGDGGGGTTEAAARAKGGVEIAQKGENGKNKRRVSRLYLEKKRIIERGPGCFPVNGTVLPSERWVCFPQHALTAPSDPLAELVQVVNWPGPVTTGGAFGFEPGKDSRSS